MLEELIVGVSLPLGPTALVELILEFPPPVKPQGVQEGLHEQEDSWGQGDEQKEPQEHRDEGDLLETQRDGAFGEDLGEL